MTETVLVTAQVKVAEPVKPALSVAVTVTEQVPAVVGVPVMVPVDGVDREPGGQAGGRPGEGGPGRESVAEAVRALMAVPDTGDWLPGLARSPCW